MPVFAGIPLGQAAEQETWRNCRLPAGYPTKTQKTQKALLPDEVSKDF